MAKKNDPDVQKWLSHVAAYDREFKKWESRVEKLLKRYKDEGRDTNRGLTSRFNILWSNVSTLVPAVFARLPKPDVQRRFRDQDPVGRVASMILERALDFEVMHYSDYRNTMKECVYDRFLGGRGTAWVRYEPHFRAARLQVPQDGVSVTEDVDEPNEELDYECSPVDYVHWRDFGHSVARTWEEVGAVWRHVYMSREALVERFGSKTGNRIPLDSVPDAGRDKAFAEIAKCGHIIEIWDKDTKRARWLAKSLGEFVDERDDPLQLEDFFPCPRPLFATTTSESLVPTPDFCLYQDQAQELDLLSDRIDGLVKALQIKGVYDAAQPEIGRLFQEATNGTLVPVKNWAAFVEKSGLKGSLDLVDIAPIAAALRECYAAREEIKGQIYELTGISDIIRGQTMASETATAQQIKGQFASLRLRASQEDVALFATDLLRLKAQVICNRFDPQTVAAMAGIDQFPEMDKQFVGQAMQLLFGERLVNPDVDSPNPLRSFRVEIAADSLVQLDEQAEKQSRVEFLTAVGGFVKNLTPVMVQVPMMAPLLLELLKFTTQTYKAGKQIEGEFDATAEQMKQAAMQPKPPEVPPEIQVEHMRQQAEEKRFSQQLQADSQKHAAELAAEREKQQNDITLEREKQANEIALKREAAQTENALRASEHGDSMTLERQKMMAAAGVRGEPDENGQMLLTPMEELARAVASLAQSMQASGERMEALSAQVAQSMRVAGAPRRLARDPRTGEKIAVPMVQ